MSRNSRLVTMVFALALLVAVPALANASLVDTIQERGKLIVGIQTSAPLLRWSMRKAKS